MGKGNNCDVGFIVVFDHVGVRILVLICVQRRWIELLEIKREREGEEVGRGEGGRGRRQNQETKAPRAYELCNSTGS